MPGAGRPTSPARLTSLPGMKTKGAVSVAPRPVSIRMRSPVVASAMALQRLPDVLREVRAGVEHQPQPAEEALAQRASLGSRCGSSASKPLGTLT